MTKLPQLSFVIPGKPIAKKRPRFARRGKFVTTYNEQETEEGRWLFEAQKYTGEKFFKGPVVLQVSFLMPIPKSTSKKRAKAMLCNEIKHVKKPDLDNLVKFVKDCLNGELWRDDSQVVTIWADKRYGMNPCTLIFVGEV